MSRHVLPGHSGELLAVIPSRALDDVPDFAPCD